MTHPKRPRGPNQLDKSIFGNVPLPAPGKIHALAALHCQRGYAAHLTAIRDAAISLACRAVFPGVASCRNQSLAYPLARQLHHRVTHQFKQKDDALMAKELKKLDELFHDTLKDIYFAEKKILSTLPKMAKAAQSEELKAAFEKHYTGTKGQIERLEKVFAVIEKKPQGKTCAAIVGITDEGAEIMEDYKGSPALDAGLLGAAQAVEHYEISRYGTLIAWAEELGLDDAVSLLEETLEEEEATDEALTEIAKTAINQQAQAA
jgi:ferritin-like metal-binding protein YciE